MNYHVLSMNDFPEEISTTLDQLYRQIKLEEIQELLQQASPDTILQLKTYVKANPDTFNRDEVSRELADIILSPPIK